MDLDRPALHRARFQLCGIKHVRVMKAFPFQLTSVPMYRSMVLSFFLFCAECGPPLILASQFVLCCAFASIGLFPSLIIFVQLKSGNFAVLKPSLIDRA